MLVKSINAGSYTSEVNRFLQNNGIKATQSQFDALVSFSYNIGSGYWNGTSQMDLKRDYAKMQLYRQPLLPVQVYLPLLHSRAPDYITVRANQHLYSEL